eukprot:TRINITY_DN78864_c0_g1_i1.p1 TRINITY_DN78864_c0_g1~~TRINITY_DN78864_c0_g1_i1.p1  ORF type:complete len:619 (-),score=136.91 TRINITY_DN78864_c0_g1_i1:266-2122(-)
MAYPVKRVDVMKREQLTAKSAGHGKLLKSRSEPYEMEQLPWKAVTLASLGQEQEQKQIVADDTVSVAASAALAEHTGRKGTALLIASAPSHEIDRAQKPQPLLELGGVSLVSHALWQLNSAHFALVIVVVGYQGDEVQKGIMGYVEGEKDIFEGLRLRFIDLGKGWRGGRVASVAACRSVVQPLLKQDGNLVVVGADHIFDAKLLEEAASTDLAGEGDEACVLVELDLEGMRGIPSSAVFCATRPLHGADRIYKIGNDLEAYSGLEAGVIVFTPDCFRNLAEQAEAHKTFQMADFLSSIARRGTLRLMKTAGRTWFSVETEESFDFTSKGLRSCGQEYDLADGRKVHLIGLPRKIETSPSDGGEWAEFSVERWRSAVYTAKSFFQELFVDTTDFIGALCDELGGTNEHGPLLVEVGCGTGEALLPLFERAKYTCGMDFNPHFVEFCMKNVPSEVQDRVKHLVGDAQVLRALLDDQLPRDWVENRPKVVICVGNTIGIMPPEIREKVYQEMKYTAGEDGYMVVVYWNGNKFGDAVQNFYHKNPQLCGKFTGECIDLDTCTLTTPSGYCTHWTKPEEARKIFELEVGAEVTQILEKGNGVLVAGRMRKPRSPSTSSTATD